MASGPNKHHIPQFHQRAFGVKRSGKPKEIWRFEPGAEPELVEIKEAGAEHEFYPEDLDAKITGLETDLSRLVARIRDQASGASIDHEDARAVIMHLAPRAAHMRASVQHAAVSIFEGARRIFANDENMARLMGLNDRAPSSLFKDRLAPAVAEDKRFEMLQLPDHVIADMVFWFVRERREQFLTFSHADEGFRAMISKAGQLAKQTHSQILDRLIDQQRPVDLSQYSWTVEDASPPSVIMPDCIAIGLEYDGGEHPFMMSNRAKVATVVCALSSTKLLVGRRSDAPSVDLTSYNRMAARCATSFFASTDDPQLAQLNSIIGERATVVIDDGVATALVEYEPPAEPDDEERRLDPEVEASVDPADLWPPLPPFQITFVSWADDGTPQKIGNVVGSMAAALRERMPLRRIDGMTFAHDYAAALGAIERGVPGLEPAKTVGPEVGIGYAMCVLVMRDDMLKGRLVFADWVGYALVNDEDENLRGLALHAVAQLFTQVAITEIVDESFPELILQKTYDPKIGWQFPLVYPALEGYVASLHSACFGDKQEILGMYRQALRDALKHAHDTILPARLDYRYHGDFPRFLKVVEQAIQRVLSCAASLLGHCEDTGLPVLGNEPELADALEQFNLGPWLKMFGADLKAFEERFGTWKSLDELLYFNGHVNRLCWQYGLFPSSAESDGGFIHVPLVTDAQALFEADAENR